MGNGCCKVGERVETLELDGSQNGKDAIGQQQMISLSDSDEEYQPKQQKQQFGIFKEGHKNSQLSTGPQYSFQSLPSEQHFSNFVTFQAIPSQQGIKGNVFSKFQQEMNDMAVQQSKNQKNQNHKSKDGK